MKLIDHLRGIAFAILISIMMLLIWYVNYLKRKVADLDRHLWLQSEIIRVNKDCDSLRQELKWAHNNFKLK